jgi:hypothetical protein
MVKDTIEVKTMWGLLIIQLVVVWYLGCYLARRVAELESKGVIEIGENVRKVR